MMGIASELGGTMAHRSSRAAQRVLDFCERNAGPLLVLLIVVGAMMRVAYFGRYWLNPDEGIYWQTTVVSPREAAGMIRANAHPPLYYELLRIVRALGGGIDAMRGVSLAAGIALPAVVFLLARRWAGSAAGVFAALMTLNAPAVREFSLLIRPYAILGVTLGLGTLCFFRFLEDGLRRDALAWGLAWATAMLLHYSTYIVLAGAVAYTAWLVATARIGKKTALSWPRSSDCSP